MARVSLTLRLPKDISTTPASDRQSSTITSLSDECAGELDDAASRQSNTASPSDVGAVPEGELDVKSAVAPTPASTTIAI